jgi:calcineurin-like phosphoesterase
MRYNEFVKFKVSKNSVEMNAVIIKINKNGNEIKTIKKDLR